MAQQLVDEMRDLRRTARNAELVATALVLKAGGLALVTNEELHAAASLDLHVDYDKPDGVHLRVQLLNDPKTIGENHV